MGFGNLNVGRCKPTADGIVTTKYRDGVDLGTVPPTLPVLGPPVPTTPTSIDVPIETVATTPVPPITYVLQRSIDAFIGFTNIASGDIFVSDGIYTDSTGLSQSTTYYYRVKAIGGNSRESAFSLVVSGTTPSSNVDTTPPSIPGSFTSKGNGSGGIVLTWAASTDNVGVVAYDVLRGLGDGAGNPINEGVFLNTPITGLTFTDTPLTAGTEYYHKVRARDAAGNVSTLTGALYRTTNIGSGDFTVPTVPGTIIITAPSSSVLNATFTASTDNQSGIKGYEIEAAADVAGVPGTWSVFRTVAQQGTALNFSETGLAPGTKRWYRARAQDNALPTGLFSAFNTQATGTTQTPPPPDVTPPSVPSNNVASGVNTTQIRITTNGSTDTSGILGYKLFVSDTQAGAYVLVGGPITFTGLIYTYTVGAASTTRWFKLSAVDGSTNANESAQSPEFVGTTLDPPPQGVTYILNDGFENGVPTAIYNPALTDGAGTLAVETTHAREGTRSLHTVVTKNGTTNFRQEYRVRTSLDNSPSANSQMYWCGFGLYIDPATTIATQSVIFQWHTVTSNSGASPVISVRMLNNRWQFTSDSLPDELFGPTIVKGVWHDLVFQILWRTTNTGICRIWIDGVLYIDKANMRTTWAGENNIPWIHVGSYSSAWKLTNNPDPNGTIHSQWHDALRIAVGNNIVYEHVVPLGDRLSAP